MRPNRCLSIAILSILTACESDGTNEKMDIDSDPQNEADAGTNEMPVDIPARPGNLAACSAAQETRLGTIEITSADTTDTRLTEISGLAVSRTQPIMWVHDDSGSEPNVYALSLGNEGIEDGTPLAIFKLPAVAVRDWEDIAIGPGPMAGSDHIYLGDIGDKNRETLESDIVVYRFPEPVVNIPQMPLTSGDELQTTVIPEIESLRANYPEGLLENADALFVDALGGRNPDLYVITSGNGINTPNRLFRMKSSSPSETVELQFLMALFGGESGDPEISGADMSADGTKVVIRTLQSAAMWTRARGATVEATMATKPCSARLPQEDASSEEGGAIGFAPDGSGYYTSVEGDPAPLWFVPLFEN